MMGLQKKHPAEVSTWEDVVIAWEWNPTENPNPYHVPEEYKLSDSLSILFINPCLATSIHEIWHQLVEEEHHWVNEGSLAVYGSPLSFILMGLSFADMQYVPKCEVLICVSDYDPRLSLQTDSAKKDSTPAQLASIYEQQTALLRWLRGFCESQTMFMPGLLADLNFFFLFLFLFFFQNEQFIVQCLWGSLWAVYNTNLLTYTTNAYMVTEGEIYIVTLAMEVGYSLTHVTPNSTRRGG